MTIDKETFETRTGYTCTYEEFILADCSACKEDCPHRGCYRRLPRSTGGLGLCLHYTGGIVRWD